MNFHSLWHLLMENWSLLLSTNACDPWDRSMDSSTNLHAPPHAAYFLWSCDKVYHKQEVCFLLYFLGQIVSWQYNPNLLDLNWQCTVISDHDWQLWNCPLFTRPLADLGGWIQTCPPTAAELWFVMPPNGKYSQFCVHSLRSLFILRLLLNRNRTTNTLRKDL